jgi:hypothetical protein
MFVARRGEGCAEAAAETANATSRTRFNMIRSAEASRYILSAEASRYMIFFCAARASTTASARKSKAPAIIPDEPS